MRKCLTARLMALLTCLLLSAMPAVQAEQPQLYRYSATFGGTFDTIVTLIGYAGNEAAFNENYNAVYDIFTEYHRLFAAGTDRSEAVRFHQLVPGSRGRVRLGTGEHRHGFRAADLA